jgi:hypothetical protein
MLLKLRFLDIMNLYSIRLRTGTNGDFSDGNEPSGCTKGQERFEQLRETIKCSRALLRAVTCI